MKYCKNKGGETDEARVLRHLSDIPHFGIPKLKETFLHND